MQDNPVSDGSVPDNQEDLEYRLLRQMMARRKGFNFILVVYQGDAARDRYLGQLTTDLDGLGVDHLILDLRQYPDNVVLITAARELLEAHPAADGRHRALSVIGLERHLDYGSGGTRDKATGLLPDANLHRDLFPEKVPVPMALWGTSLAQPAIAHRAPDLWHWRVGSADLVGDAAGLPRAALLEAEIPRPEQEWQRQDEASARKREALLRELLAEDDTPVDATGPAARRRAGLTRELGRLLFNLGEVTEATALLRDALDRYRHQGMEREQALTQGDTAEILFQNGDLDAALSVYRDEELPVFERLGDDRAAAVTRGRIADILVQRGDLDTALRMRLEAVLPVFERLGDERSAALTWGKVANILQQRGDLDEALRIRRDEALPVFERLGDDWSVALMRGRIADILRQRGDLDGALRLRREEELPVYERLGDVRSAALTRGKIAKLLLQRGDLDAALRITRDEVLPVFERLGDTRSAALTRGQIADILSCRGDLEAALSIYQEDVLPVIERLGDLREAAVTRTTIALTLYLQSPRANRDEAIALLTQARDALASMGLPEAELAARELAHIQSTPTTDPTP